MSLSSVIRYVRAIDTTSTTGAGKTGLAFGDFTAKYLVEGGTLVSLTAQDISTLGTYQAPTANTNIRIKELNSGAPTQGIYEVHFHNDQVAVANKNIWLFLSASGALIQPLWIPVADLAGRLPDALNNGAIKSDVQRWKDSVPANLADTDKVPASVQHITGTAANRIADHVRRRTQANVEASDDGDALSLNSEYGFIQQAQESNTTDNAGKLTVYKADGTTELGQITIATDGDAEPITGVS